MIYSMTGYALQVIGVENTACGAFQMEIKSVNSRYLDFQFRITDELRALEPVLRERFSVHFSRGKIECRVSALNQERRQADYALNQALLEQLSKAQRDVLVTMPEAAPLSVGELLRWPGMLDEGGEALEAIFPRLLELADRTVKEFIDSRAREGQKLATAILERVARMRALARELEPRIPSVQAAFQEKLKQRLIEALGSADDERIRQEVAVFAVRIDIAEELTRLRTHLDEVERVLRVGGVCGKRLDFLMQELNREANTLGSKSLAVEVSQAAMEFKLLIEQMREQIQNLE